MKGEKAIRSNELESIRNVIRLLLVSSHEDYRFDHTFGSDIWNNEFDSGRSEKFWLEEIVNNFNDKLKSFEPRLTQTSVRATLKQKDVIIGSKEAGNPRMIRRVLDLHVEGRMSSTNEVFSDRQSIIIGPMSFDQL